MSESLKTWSEFNCSCSSSLLIKTIL